jgi:hypothetical protein
MAWTSCPKCSKPIHYYDVGPAIPEGEAVRVKTYGPCGCGWHARTVEKAVNETSEEGPVPAAGEGAVK